MNEKLKNFIKRFQLNHKIKKNNTKLNLRTLASDDIQNEYSPEELENFFAEQDSLSTLLDSLKNIDAKPDTTDNLQAWDMHNIVDERDRPGVEYASKQSLTRVLNSDGNVETDNSSLHTILENAGLYPGAGAVPDLANTALYGLEGDKEGALMSLLAAVPGIGMAATAAKKANKARIKIDKKGKIIKDKNFSDSFDALSKEVDETQLAELNKGGIEQFSEFQDAEAVREQARKIIKKLREAKTLEAVKRILGQFD